MRRTVLVAVGLLLASLAPACASKEVACEDPTTATTVQMLDDGYAPGCVQTAPGATLTIQNAGEAPHTFTVSGTTLEAKADPGASASLAVTDITPGTYLVICTLHPDMRAALKVV